MQVQAIKTDKITAGSMELTDLLDTFITDLSEGSVVAITSKVVSLCQNRTIPKSKASKDELIVQESTLYLPASFGKYGQRFTITQNTLIAVAGIDESNGNNLYVLWPKDVQGTANNVRAHLKSHFGLQKVGVIITDSTSRPSRRGASGIMLAHSGFLALHDYVGKADLFGKPFVASQADVGGGLAAAAVLQMGEGAEQTPLAVISDLGFITFQDRNPTSQELADIYIPIEDDLFAPFLTSVGWKQGEAKDY